jgi:uncharacterized membrane protein
MPKMPTQTQAKPLFAATLTPHRSLSRRGLRIVVAVLAISATIPGIYFFAEGMWPVVAFLMVDVALAWWALSTSMRDGRRYEKVTLWPDQLELKQVDGNGKETMTRFAPFNVKLVVDRDFNERTTGLRLRSKDRDLVIGEFLSQDDKSSFAKALGTALRKARR